MLAEGFHFPPCSRASVLVRSIRRTFDASGSFDAKPLVMFFVGRHVGSDLSKVYPTDLYAAVRGWWRVADPGTWQQEYNLVLARNTERVLGAFTPKEWVPAGTGSALFNGNSGQP